MIRTLTPSLVSQSARTRPVGPAPMIRTSLCVMSFSIAARVSAVGQHPHRGRRWVAPNRRIARSAAPTRSASQPAFRHRVRGLGWLFQHPQEGEDPMLGLSDIKSSETELQDYYTQLSAQHITPAWISGGISHEP